MDPALHPRDSAAAAADHAPSKNPPTASRIVRPSEPAPSDGGKPADAPAAAVNGVDSAPSTALGATTAPASNGHAANGSAGKIGTDSPASEHAKQGSDEAQPVTTRVAERPSDQNDQSKTVLSSLPESEPAATDGKEGVSAASAVPKPASPKHEPAPPPQKPAPLPLTEPAPAVSREADKEDVEVKDADSDLEKPSVVAPAPATDAVPDAVPAPAAAAVPDISGSTGATEAATTTPATSAAGTTGGKRKAAAVEEPVGKPTAKKHKGPLSKAVDKAKEAVQGVKEKAKPGRKPGSGNKAKKQAAPPPLGRTQRKTRSQARAE